MFEEAIMLRPARLGDVDEIWHLLHNEGMAWDLAKITGEIGRLFVLTYQKRYLGVLCGTFMPGREELSWVVVHPMYPDGPLRTAMIQGLWGVLCRRPYTAPGLAGRKVTSSGRRTDEKEKELPPTILKPGVLNGISGEQKL